MPQQFHESFERDAPSGSSERSFGLVFAGVFAVLGLLPIVHGHAARWWAVAAACVFAAFALIAPRWLIPLNRAWTALGHLLNRIMSPVVMTLLFVVAVLPTALMLKISGRDPLRLKFDSKARTYWQVRTPPGPPPASFTEQF